MYELVGKICKRNACWDFHPERINKARMSFLEIFPAILKSPFLKCESKINYVFLKLIYMFKKYNPCFLFLTKKKNTILVGHITYKSQPFKNFQIHPIQWLTSFSKKKKKSQVSYGRRPKEVTYRSLCRS
jgi:hypothetical protein